MKMDLIDNAKTYLNSFSSHMDFEGQRKAERIFQVILVVHGVVGFLIGYGTQQLSLAVYTLAIGFAISCLIILPPWPYFRRNPIKWQKAADSPIAAASSSNSAQKKKKK